MTKELEKTIVKQKTETVFNKNYFKRVSKWKLFLIRIFRKKIITIDCGGSVSCKTTSYKFKNLVYVSDRKFY
jgi:hypothetical protein